MSVIGNEFSGLPIADLIGGPLKAACDAQVRLATATANFINAVGFNPVLGPNGKPTGQMQPRQVDFSFWKPLPIQSEVLATGTVTLALVQNKTDADATAVPVKVGPIMISGVDLLNGQVVSYNLNLGLTARDIASKINDVSAANADATKKYLASAGGGTITITAPAGSGSKLNSKAIAATVAPDSSILTATCSTLTGGVDADTEAKVQKVALSVPFLAIVNVPSLMVKTVDITFDMEVKSSESHKDDQSVEVAADVGIHMDFGIVSADVKIHAAISSHQENTRSTDRSAKYHVQVTARDDGMPEGLSRVLDILQRSIAPVGVDTPKSLSDAHIAQKTLN